MVTKRWISLMIVWMLAVPLLFAVPENERASRYTPRDAKSTEAWQQDLRDRLFDLMKMTDLVNGAAIPFEAKVLKTEARDGYTLDTIELNATAGRRFTVALARPAEKRDTYPAVVAIHGHGGDRFSTFNPDEGIYKTFGVELARRGYMVIAANVGQHDVYEDGRTLMGERLWDLMRCVDYLASLDEVDSARIGCGGLSLGGEMAMWLGAMDTRVAATVSCGFLTRMDQMEQNHCMCWKFDGLRELVDFADIYAMTAPRALQCQNGFLEPETQFTVPLAREALADIQPVYAAFNASDKLGFVAHAGAHEVAIEPLLGFFEFHLNK